MRGGVLVRLLKMDFSEAKKGYIHHWIQQEVPGAPLCQKPGENRAEEKEHTQEGTIREKPAGLLMGTAQKTSCQAEKANSYSHNICTQKSKSLDVGPTGKWFSHFRE